MRLPLLIPMITLIMMSLLLSGCPEKSPPPVTQNQNSFSLVSKVYAKPTQPTPAVAPIPTKKPAMKSRHPENVQREPKKTKDEPKQTPKEKDSKSIVKDKLKNKVRDPKMPPPPT